MPETIDTTDTTPLQNDAQVSNVLILMTGGTICSVKSTSGFIPAGNFLETCMAPRPSFNDGTHPTTLPIITTTSNQTPTPHKALTTPTSEYGRRIRYCVYEFSPLLDSSAVDADVWLKIVGLIWQNYDAFDGFVVLHGTDTMAYSASALSFMLQDLGKPVVLTGSQRPMGELQNDSTDNLLGSLILAGHFCIPEVTLYFNYKVCVYLCPSFGLCLRIRSTARENPSFLFLPCWFSSFFLFLIPSRASTLTPISSSAATAPQKSQQQPTTPSPPPTCPLWQP